VRPYIWRVDKLVADFVNGDILLPEMQRDYVWRGNKVRDFLDSLYRGYPTGTILLWEAGKEAAPLRDAAVVQKEGLRSTNILLMDGQQRITSLSALLQGKSVKVRHRTKSDHTLFLDFLFKLEHPDELDGSIFNRSTKNVPNTNSNNLVFVGYSKSMEAMPQWVKVSDVFTTDPAILLRQKKIYRPDELWDKYLERLIKLRGIREYEHPVYLISGLY